LSVQVYDEKGKRIGQSQLSRREFQGGLMVVEEVFQMADVPFDKPGIYEFRLLANHAELEGGLIILRVLEG